MYQIDGLVCCKCILAAKEALSFRLQCKESFLRASELYKFSSNKFIKPSRNIGTSVDSSTQTNLYHFYQCENCAEIFGQKELDVLNQKKKSSFSCRICMEKFTRLINLHKHMLSLHQDPRSIDTCYICDVRFTSCELLKYHLTEHDESEETCEEDLVHKGEEIQELLIESVKSKTGTEGPFNLDNKYDNWEDEQIDSLSNFEENIQDNTHENIKNETDSDDNVLMDLEYVEDNGLELYEDDVHDTASEHQDSSDKSLDQLEVTENSESSDDQDDKKKQKVYAKNQCKVCERRFSRSAHLIRHMKSHNKIRDHKCTHCDKSFSRIDHLRLHMFNHSDTKPFRCEKCGKQFIRGERYRSHIENNKCNVEKSQSSYCHICKRNFSTPNYLRIHMKIHTDTEFVCQECNLEFDQRLEYIKHMRTHNQREFLCPECGMTFRRADYLAVHLRRHQGVRPFQCRYCDKRFPRSTEVKMHERYHTGEKTQVCNICDKRFHRACNLKVHMRIHTGEKPYKCPHCERSFAQTNDLKTHIRRHTGERFKCDLCSASFLYSHFVTKHKRDAHNLDVKVLNPRVEKFLDETKESDNGGQGNVIINDMDIDFKIEPLI